MIRYAYLWAGEYQQGREEGVKDRPCVILASKYESQEHALRVLVLPITHTEPYRPEHTIELSHRVKQHLGMDENRSWVVLTESNAFSWPGPDIRPVQIGGRSGIAYGFLPPRLFTQIAERYTELEMRQQSLRIQRTE
ncbi:MAG: type II toxin-antitoxin system PemK/MazF family toxin [Caldilineaceae bacterium]